MTTAEDIAAAWAAVATWMDSGNCCGCDYPEDPNDHRHDCQGKSALAAIDRLDELRKRTLEEAAVEADQLAEEEAWRDLLDQVLDRDMPPVLQRLISAGAARKIAKRIRALLEPKP